MPFYVYIIYSKSTASLYKGQTNNLVGRISRHNNGYEASTSRGRPWQLVWYCIKDTRREALLLEKKLKNLSVNRIKSFIDKYPIEDSITGLDVFNPWV